MERDGQVGWEQGWDRVIELASLPISVPEALGEGSSSGPVSSSPESSPASMADAEGIGTASTTAAEWSGPAGTTDAGRMDLPGKTDTGVREPESTTDAGGSLASMSPESSSIAWEKARPGVRGVRSGGMGGRGDSCGYIVMMPFNVTSSSQVVFCPDLESVASGEHGEESRI